MGVDFGPLGVDVRHLGVDYRPLGVDFSNERRVEPTEFEF